MYVVRMCGRLAGAVVVLSWSVVVSAQGVQAPAEQQEHDMSMMMREGSGTSWLPDASPMYMFHRQRGPWMLMAHENAFVQFLHESGDRGADQAGSINWAMGMAERSVGRGHLGL